MARKMNFFEDFYRAGLRLGERERKELYAAMLDYYFADKEPEVSGGAAAVFEVVRERIDLSKTRSEVGADGGGRPKQTRSKPKAKPKQTPEGPEASPKQSESKAEANGKQNESKPEASPGFAAGDREGDREREEEHTKSVCSSARAEAKANAAAQANADPPNACPDGTPLPREARRYPRPGPAEVEAFVAASGVGCAIDGQAFCGWYDDHGWPPMGWQQTALRWAREDRDRKVRRAAAERGKPGEVSADAARVAEELARFDLV